MTAFDHAYEQVCTLVAKFQQNYHHYMSPGYSEAEARQDFIDDFFTALGWDVRHRRQTNPYEQEVKIEKSQNQQNESARKRADYAFYTAPNFKDEVFFAEAKKPSVLIQSNPQHYFQTIKYGWNSGCPVCVLTDFEEFAVIDCRQKPDIKYALNGKHKNYRYTDYTDKEKFAEIYWIFSREAVGQNSLHKYAAELPKAKGKTVQKALFKGAYQAIDDSFLEYIDGIRENIAKAFKKTNPELNSEQLTEATQRTVDRLVFIRFLEDKFIETDEHVNEWTSWKQFITDCRKLDAKYNGVVFKKHFIDEPGFIGADEQLFLDICSDISSLNSPYDFNYIPIHILGSIYERFLGKIVIATEKRVRIEEKPEVRKAGGVYYTPKYIVDYIVQNTVGNIIATLTPKQIAEKRFADIACGSGSFLIGVYDCLLDYHKRYYAEKLQGKTELDKRSEDFGNTEFVDGQWRLTLKLKQDILLNNIYGVDIDTQAVEVTQLSLFLKMLEEESVSSTRQGALFSKVLPDLSKNIVCGNSLIGWDIMNGQLFENEELKKLNPMDYEAAFPAIMRNGGFDAVVGNPPWVDIKGLEPVQVRYYFSKYNSSENRINLYALFLEAALKRIKVNGTLGYIIPNSILFQSSYMKLRKIILEQFQITEIIRLPDNVFSNVKAETVILDIKKTVEPQNTKVVFYERNNKINSIVDTEATEVKQLDQRNWQKHELVVFDIFSNSAINSLLEKIQLESLVLEKICEFCLGITPYDKYKGHTKKQIEERVFHSAIAKDKTYKKLLEGSNVERFLVSNYCKEYISYGPWLGAPRESRFFSQERILVRQIVSGNPLRIYAGFTNEELYNTQSIFNLLIRSEYCGSIYFVLGLLNSTLINFYHKYKYLDLSKNLFQKILIQNAKKIPIVNLDFNKKNEKHQHDALVALVTQMLEAKKQLAAAVTDNDKNFLQNKCASIDRQIDKLVYELYGLTEEEIKLVEGEL